MGNRSKEKSNQGPRWITGFNGSLFSVKFLQFHCVLVSTETNLLATSCAKLRSSYFTTVTTAISLHNLIEIKMME